MIVLVRDEGGAPVEFVGSWMDITARKQAEGALARSEERFRGFTETTMDIMYEVDIESRFLYVSPAVERVLGYKPDYIFGRSLQDFVPESEVPKAADALARTRQGQDLRGFEFQVLRKDGSSASIEANAIPMFRDGEVVGVQGIVRDITKRKKALEALREREERYELLFESTPDGILVADIET